jgi:hypothetical protein
MKKLLAVAAFGLAFTLVDSGASAQQHQTTQTTQATPAPHFFPMPAATYEVVISKALEKMRAVKPVGPMTQGDLNKVILLLRECASRAEADGIVTAAEMNGCNAQIRYYKQERMVEVMANSGPSEWQRWSSQVAQTNGSAHH